MDEKIKMVERYNFWNNDVPVGYIRKSYIEKIWNYLGNKLIKVLIGQRRVGKSYIMRQLASNLISNGVKSENILMINKEFESFSFIETHNDLDKFISAYENKFKPQGKIYIFIDEVQEIEGWEKAINSYSQDYSKDYELFISGSNSKMLSSELSSLLSGRYIEFKIFPFSYDEYCLVNNVENSRQTYLEYIKTGGFPELINLNGDETKRNYVSALKDTILLKDIIQRHQIKDVKLLEDIFVYLVNNASNLISITSIVNWFKSKGRKTSYDTVANYIEYIGNAYLIHKAERYNIKGKEIISGNYKFYVNDLSFKNFLYKGFGYGTGYILENVVYLELLRHGYDVYVGNIKDKEVDFVAFKDDNVTYIQSTYMLIDEQTITREYSALKSINDNYRKIIVSLDDIKMPSQDGIEHVLAWELSSCL